jgi:hypothetical protein
MLNLAAAIRKEKEIVDVTTETPSRRFISWDFLTSAGASDRASAIKATEEWLETGVDGDGIELDEADVMTLYLCAGQYSLSLIDFEVEVKAKKERAESNAIKYLKDIKYSIGRVKRIEKEAKMWRKFLMKRIEPGAGVSKNFLLQTVIMKSPLLQLFDLMDGDDRLKNGVRRSQHFWYRFDQASLLVALGKQVSMFEEVKSQLKSYEVLKSTPNGGFSLNLKNFFMNDFHLDMSDASAAVFAPCMQETRRKEQPTADRVTTILSGHMVSVADFFLKAHARAPVKDVDGMLVEYKNAINWVQANFKVLRYRGKNSSSRILYHVTAVKDKEFIEFRKLAIQKKVGMPMQ